MKLKSNTHENKERMRNIRMNQNFPLTDAKTTEIPVQNELQRRNIPFHKHFLIFNKNKPQNKQGKVLMIDAEKDFLEGKNQNTLRKQDIDKIIKAYDQYQDIEKYARVIDVNEIEENEYNLNVRRYIDGSEEQEQIDVKQVWKDLQKIEHEREEVSRKISKFIDELGYK